jgi:hypothetical protein
MRRVSMRDLHFGCGESLQSSLYGVPEPARAARRIERPRKRRPSRKTERTNG